jgi:PAS domain S-box-containing protein
MSFGLPSRSAPEARTQHVRSRTGITTVVAIVAVAAAIRWLLDPWLGHRHTLPTFLFAVVFATWRVGIGGGVVTLLLGYVVANLLFVTPHGGPSLLALPDLAALDDLPVYVARGAVLMALVQALSRKDEALQRANANFETIAAGIGDVLWILDAERRRLEYVSPAYERVWGRSSTPLLTDLAQWSDTVHPSDRERVTSEWRNVLESGRGEVEYRIVRPDADVRWIRDRAFPTRIAGRIAGISTDVTRLHEAEHAIFAQTHLLKIITDTATTAIFMMDPSSCLTFMNPAAEAMTGSTLDEARGRVLHDLIHPTRPDGSQNPIRECPIDRARRERIELRDHEDLFVRKDGKFFPVLVNARPVISDDPSLGTVLEVRDISRQKELEAQHAGILGELHEADRRKDEFLAMLAHELRNPLAPIRNAAHVLRLVAQDEPKIAVARDIIDRQVVHMTRLIDDLLDVSRITRSKIDLKKERLQLREVIENTVEASRPVLEAAQHTLSFNPSSDPGSDVWIDGDRARLVQVLTNLLTNAAKFTPRGGHVALRAARIGDDVQISVRDTGVGIAREAQQRIFELFQQESVSLERAHGGLGIGLTLVKRLVEMHGGTVSVSSDGTGKGSEFVVTLPVLDDVVSRADEVTPTRRAGSGPVRILVVEDNEDAAESFRMLLELHGHEVRVACDGLEGLRAFEEFAPEVAFLDLGLPGIDGFGVAERIRAIAGRRPVLVAISGYGRDEDKQRALEAGFDAHLTKPVDHDRIEAFLQSLASRGAAIARTVH